MKVIIFILVSVCAWGQFFPFPGPGHRNSTPVGPIGTPVGSQTSNTGASQTVTSAAHTTTTGDLLFVIASTQQTAVGGFNAVTLPTISAGSATFVPIIPAGGGYILGARITNGGSGCTTAPNVCTISGGGGSMATCSATETGGSVDAITVSSVVGDFTSTPTISISGSGCTGVTAEVTAYGKGGASTAMAWYAKNIVGGTSATITVDFGSAASAPYNGISVAEVANLNHSAPLDVSPSAYNASASSITSGSFTTATSNEIAICGSRVEALGQTWTAGTGYTLLSAAQVTDTFQTIEYQIFSSVQTGVTASISSGGTAARELICGVFKQ